MHPHIYSYLCLYSFSCSLFLFLFFLFPFAILLCFPASLLGMKQLNHINTTDKKNLFTNPSNLLTRITFIVSLISAQSSYLVFLALHFCLYWALYVTLKAFLIPVEYLSLAFMTYHFSSKIKKLKKLPHLQYFCVLPYISTQSILHPFSLLLALQFLSFSLLSTFLQPPLTICFLLRIMKCYQNAIGPRYTNKCTQRNLNLGTNKQR